MALSRLRKTIEDFISQYQGEDDELRRNLKADESRKARLCTATRWRAERHFGLCNNVLSMFASDDHLGQRAFNLLERAGYFNTAAIPFAGIVMDVDGIDHDMPLVRDLSDKDLLCVVNALKKHAANEDSLETDFPDYLRFPGNDDFAQKVDAVYAQLKSHCTKGAITFSQAFVDVFGDKYLKPLLINQGFNHEKAANLTSDLSYICSLALSNSLSQIVMSACLRSTLENFLNLFGISEKTIEDIVSKAATIFAVYEDPLNLIELGVSKSAAESGEFAAWQLIYQLPKLKHEPVVEEAAVKDREAQRVPATLRLRYV